jgi:membrane protein DedA with SNARE-associated domain
MALPAFAKHALSRSGAAVCGVIGFHQHMGIWPALLGAIGWLIAFDHIGYLLRRRYSDRVRAWLSRWHPIGWAGSRLVNSVRKWVADPSRMRASYRTFVVDNTANATVWGSAFVGVGYLLTARWHGGHTNGISQAAALTGAGVILGVALTIYQHRHTADHNVRDSR